MPRPLQRMPLELGLDLNINQLLRDGFIKPGQITPFKDCHWLDADGDTKANARITADMTKGSTVANAARYGTMHIVADWIHQIIELVACPRHFGGWQWYFVCPRESRRVSVLWSLPARDFSPGGSRGAIALRIFPSITHRGLGRIIWRTSFATASAGRVRLRIGMCHRSRRGCGGGPMNTFPRDARDIALKPLSHRENIASMATWFSLRATLKIKSKISIDASKLSNRVPRCAAGHIRRCRSKNYSGKPTRRAPSINLSASARLSSAYSKTSLLRTPGLSSSNCPTIGLASSTRPARASAAA